MDDFNTVLLAGTALLLVAVVAVRLASRTGLPALLIYLAVGLGVGEAGLGVQFSDYDLTSQLGLVALALILAEGGLTTRWSVVRPVLPFATVLATLGVAVSVAVVAGLAHLVLGVDVRTAVILGSVVASTDAAAVFSVLRRLPLRGRIGAALEAESGLNDAPVVVLVVLASSDSWGQTSVAMALGTVLLELVGGPQHDESTAAQVRELVTKSALGGVFLLSDDVNATYAALRDAGLEITQEPVEQPYGTDFGIRDPIGNHVRINQPNAATPDQVQDAYDAGAATA